jgi:fermentation-respiration switch protein FrsA (DUF1100 family)
MKLHPGRGRRILWTALLIAGVLYAGVVAFMYVYQDKLLYPGSAAGERAGAVGLTDVVEVQIRTDDGLSLLAWWLPPPQGRATVLYFHGNAGTLADRADKFRQFAAGGYGLLMPAYRGYSGNAGAPAQDRLIEDAATAARWLAKEAPGVPVVYLGESLGGSVALHLSLRFPPKAIVTEGAFDSAAQLAQARYPVLPAALLIRDKWDSAKLAPQVTVPVLVLHGRHDRVVPLAHGERLFAALPEPKRFVLVEAGGHVDLFDHGAARSVMAWLAAQGL